MARSAGQWVPDVPARDGDVPRVRDVASALDRVFPPALAESWDTGIGLTCGDPDASVRRILFAVDPAPAVVDEALALGADLLVTHHPLLFRPVQSVAASTSHGQALHRAITGRLSLFAAHTNADAARPGVSDALASAVGLTATGVLEPSGPGLAPEALDTVVTYVPVGEGDAAPGGRILESVVDALAAAGAGAIGDYSRCAFFSRGEGSFLPGPGAKPAIGVVGRVERVAEARLEMVLPRSRRQDVLAALRASHPYEEPAYHFLAHDDPDHPDDPAGSDAGSTGLGRVGDLDVPTTLGDLATRVARALPVAAGGLRFSGDPATPVRRLAVCGGAGDSLLHAAARAGADAYLTADLRHHVTQDARHAGLAGVLDAGHWATEWPWLSAAAFQLAEALRAAGLGAVESAVSCLMTDPWSGVVPREGDDREG